ncbi:MAG: TetR/AcrR family transcriptional regulator [Candidatus Binataceae bacterium]
MPSERDLNRTREKIIAAALREFSTKGLAGARTESIAKRARVNQRMIFYCFGNKAGLYREVLRRKLAAKVAVIESDPLEDFASTLVTGYEATCADLDHVRMWQWESLECEGHKIVAEEERRALLRTEIARIQRAQARGDLPPDIEAEMLLLTRIALGAFPLVFPQLTRLATGLEPVDPKFRRRWAKCLRRLGPRIAPPRLVRQETLQPQNGGKAGMKQLREPSRASST